MLPPSIARLYETGLKYSWLTSMPFFGLDVPKTIEDGFVCFIFIGSISNLCYIYHMD